MIKVEAKYTIRITGEDTVRLCHVCEMARRYIAEMGEGGRAEWEHTLRDDERLLYRIFASAGDLEVTFE